MSHPPRTGRPTTLATRGMVASPNHLASQAGLRLLQEGGNAVDAAVATSAALAVLYPQNTSLGGDLFALVYDARSDSVHALNASGRAARRATIGYYTSRGYRQIPSRGPLAALTVPGAVDGWGKLLERFGRLELGQVLRPAIEYAAHGPPVTDGLARWLAKDRDVLASYPNSAATYLRRDGRPPGLGDRLVQPGLARSLRALAEGGCEAFYRGALGREVAAALSDAGSPLSQEDFATHRSDWQEPISTTYRGQTAYQLGPNTQGFAALAILNILDGWNLHELGQGTTAYYHHLVEATRQAFRDRDRHLSDPDFVDIPLSELLSREHADRLRAKIDGHRAGPGIPQPLGGDTVFLATADDHGNLVALIHSIYWDFGSGFVAGETGVILQNRGSFFSLDPAHPNRLEPEKRTFHTLIPAMLAKDGRPWLAYGTMGGEGQPQTQTALVTRIVDFGFDLQSAIEAPRWLLGRTWGAPSSFLHLEERIPFEVIDELRAMGHPVAVAPAWDEQLGHAQAVAIDRERGVLLGGADPRGDGAAVGY
jgi:gamma-glutamyltranspeptidase/glutathione hydrolase